MVQISLQKSGGKVVSLGGVLWNPEWKYLGDLSVKCKIIITTKTSQRLNVNQNKSPGHDCIGNLIVKKAASIISKPSTDVFNLSLLTGSVPKQLKLAKVIPINK